MSAIASPQTGPRANSGLLPDAMSMLAMHECFTEPRSYAASKPRDNARVLHAQPSSHNVRS